VGGVAQSVPSYTFVTIACVFDSTGPTLALSNGTATASSANVIPYTFRDTSGVLVAPLAYWFSYTVTPTAATLILAIVLTAGTAVTITGSGNITATSNGTLFLIGPGSLT
jgi:hypothetical protein